VVKGKGGHECGKMRLFKLRDRDQQKNKTAPLIEGTKEKSLERMSRQKHQTILSSYRKNEKQVFGGLQVALSADKTCEGGGTDGKS